MLPSVAIRNSSGLGTRRSFRSILSPLRTKVPEQVSSFTIICSDALLSMQRLQHSLSFLPLLLVLLIATPLQAFAVPWASNSNQFGVAQSNQEQQSYHIRNAFPWLTWFRDSAIETVFRLPPKTTKAGPDKPNFRPSTSQLPATLLAKYGGDVVLRFNLTTASEEKALAEAADTLFLDVWEFTNDWADVRLRGDDVCTSND